MRFETITLALFSAFAAADFHLDSLYSSVVTGPGSQDHWKDYVACPSNYWNCKCLVSGDRTGRVEGKLGDDFFSVSKGFCGMGKLNFYKKNGGYEMYLDGGDGKVIGTCYRNDGDIGKQCGIALGSTIVQGGYVCYSYACNP